MVWNSASGHSFFFGAIGKFDVAIVNDARTTYAGGVVSNEAVLGCASASGDSIIILMYINCPFAKMQSGS